ncbi:PREDICTED: aldehyde dehydrogenase family 8 member A1-like [Priapulus caudatus]|uniref:Aldehyde dehydrogenase family 8 member A1-like n=1 Tax=Priapulus caudatus TaxID=37621 RepID=A0ABM1DXR6_PRICU|nr:PREDICTED: aldehyde dehydrogenase family 8 member A1-like [Priapulus caudatus]
MSYATRQASGVAGIITPWNLPMYLLTFKIAPALAAGNTVVAKPSEITSATAWMLCKVFEEAELPAGVVNMVFGSGAKAGEAIVKHPGIRMISFTGSGPVGARITEASSHFWKKVSLELGGKNAGIVFDDVNMDACVEGLIRGSFTNQGEICLCTSRIFVQTGIFHSFLEKFVKATRNIKVGDPKDPNTKMGPLVSIGHLAKVKSYVAAAKADGATIQCGEGVDPLELPPGNEGYYMRPTVITNIADTHQCMQDEIFGPVTCIVPFEAEEEASGVDVLMSAALRGMTSIITGKDLNQRLNAAYRLHPITVVAADFYSNSAKDIQELSDYWRQPEKT